MLIPVIAVASLAGLACWKACEVNRGVLTAERASVYDNAMASMSDPAKLRELAVAFDKVGLPYHADMLRKRAALREMPPEQREARREAFRKAMRSENIEGIAAVAAAYEREGGTGAAQKLRERIAGLMG